MTSSVRRLTTPLLKWPGGKRDTAETIISLFPLAYGRYFEPFFGGGAVYFALQPESAVLGDANKDLINCYLQVRDRPFEVIGELALMHNSPDEYYRIRSVKGGSEVFQAARLIYLTSLSFNGIHRVNLAGNFNVPYGHKTHLTPCDDEKILRISVALKGATLYYGDFTSHLTEASVGDIVYFDPPYAINGSNTSFLKYNANVFTWQDQIRLRDAAVELADRGCCVVVSNADHPALHSLYDSFQHVWLERPSRIAASANHRKPIRESLFVRGM